MSHGHSCHGHSHGGGGGHGHSHGDSDSDTEMTTEAQGDRHHGHSHSHAHGHGHSHSRADDPGDSDHDELLEIDESDAERLLQDLLPHIPDEIKKQPREQQIAYVRGIISQYQSQRKEPPPDRHLFDKYLEMVEAKYKVADADLLDLDKWEFVDSFSKAIKSGSPDLLRAILTEVSPGIFAFDMVKPEFAMRLMKAVWHFEAWCSDSKLQMQRPNTMNNYGAILDHFGFQDVLTALTRRCVEPLSRLLYPHVHTPPSRGSKSTGGTSGAGDGKESKAAAAAAAAAGDKDSFSLDSHHGFVVEYQMGKDRKLDFHVDAADVTLNLCLGDKFEGGDLYFGGVRCALHQQDKPAKADEFHFAHRVGQGILHLGKHRHAATPITSGHRYNLILWCRSSGFHATKSGLDDKCPSWCWHSNSVKEARAALGLSEGDKKQS